jgi:hypothetical protein
MSQPEVSKPFQSEASLSSPSSPATSTQMRSNVVAGQLSERLEKALRRTEILSYVAIGLSVIVLVYIVYLVYG